MKEGRFHMSLEPSILGCEVLGLQEGSLRSSLLSVCPTCQALWHRPFAHAAHS